MKNKIKIGSLLLLVFVGISGERKAQAVLFFSDAPTLVEVVKNITGFFLKILGLMGVIAFVLAGIMYLLSFGSEEQSEQGKRYLKYSLIGLIVALASFIIIKTIDKLLR